MYVREREQRDFATVVETMRLTGVPSHYYNHFPWETRIVVKNILAYAEETGDPLKIFTSDFYEIYDDEVHSKLEEMAMRGHDIQIVLAERPKDSDLEKWEPIAKNENVEITFTPFYDETLNHLWLAGSSYRYELPHRRITCEVTDTYPEFPARFAFKNDKDVKKAEEAWHTVLSICEREPLISTN
jgi:hypothetical protein